MTAVWRLALVPATPPMGLETVMLGVVPPVKDGVQVGGVMLLAPSVPIHSMVQVLPPAAAVPSVTNTSFSPMLDRARKAATWPAVAL